MATDSYLDFAKWYDPLFGRVLGGLREMAARIADPKSGMRVLDIGCGTGAQLAIYQEAGCEVYGIDLSQPMLRIARTKLSDQAVLTNGDATKMPFPDQAFDLVLSSLFLHQLDADVRSVALGEAKRVVHPDGRILLVDFHPGPLNSIKGKLTKFLISSVEFMAGWEHYSNSRDFLSRGGIPYLASNHHLKVRKKIIVRDGNFGIFLLNLT
jgi:ubiquinone/menaquinone biosynthesis C-methylase UbiE